MSILSAKQKTLAKDMMALSAKYRGEIIESASLVESSIEIFLAQYFTSCHEVKSMQLLTGLLATDNFSSNAKRTLFCFVIKELIKNPAHKQMLKGFERIDDTLQKKIIPMRNLVAHRKLKVTKEDIDNFDGKTIYLIGTDNQMPKMFNQEMVDREIKLNRETANRITHLIIETQINKI